jgi:hypothetical protein
MNEDFLPTDQTRLHGRFAIHRALADDGWQILYFTAKDEVGNDLADTHGIRCRTLDRLG